MRQESGSSDKHALIRGKARSAVLGAQGSLGLFPSSFCLITGTPRSGTTALGAWLGEQKGVTEFHESRILVGIHALMEEVDRFHHLNRDRIMLSRLARRLVLGYYARSKVLVGTRLLIDKEPMEPIAFPKTDYGRFLKNVRELFPESKLILLVRDPVATIWSMTRRTWGESLRGGGDRVFTLMEHIENWCSCADLILDYGSDPGTLIVPFGRLTEEPEDESRRIFEFLGIRIGKPFRPQPTKTSGFDPESLAAIETATRSRLERLEARGIYAFPRAKRS